MSDVNPAVAGVVGEFMHAHTHKHIADPDLARCGWCALLEGVPIEVMEMAQQYLAFTKGQR